LEPPIVANLFFKDETLQSTEINCQTVALLRISSGGARQWRC